MRTHEELANMLLLCTQAWEPDTCVIGNVTAAELTSIVAAAFDKCPCCGATRWLNIDCDLRDRLMRARAIT